ncbi:MAG: hypothetical protein Hyperionvirus1_29 [Hyperionvirus sp.]|uniref:Uncharacterized protein n=1 Tax=Hyperionvirus sp. TaxID=2487770 RepID=A0A3G5A5C3_9VIRU|nr:MAG: hypothetical protein Hyperionvirus1_29 [Hyperionvirus sp.]
MTVQLVGFTIDVDGIYPVYQKLGVPLGEGTVSIDRLGECLRARLPSELIYLAYCPGILELAGPDYSKVMKGVARGICVDDSCCCGRDKVMTLFWSEGTKSWSCPFCTRIVCGMRCFIEHIHKEAIGREDWLSFGPIAVDPVVVGGEWCPLCREVCKPGGNKFYETMNRSQFITFLQGRPEKQLSEYTIKTTICKPCSLWDGKNVGDMPKGLSLKQLKARMLSDKLLDSWIPPYILARSVRLFELGPLGNYENDPEFLVNLLKQYTFEQISDACIDFDSPRLGDLIDYCRDIWRQMLYGYKGPGRGWRLRTAGEVKAKEIPGTKILKALRKEIAVLESGLREGGIIGDLCGIIWGYLPWQFWNLERVITRIHNDVIKYGPAIAALLYAMDTTKKD